MGYKIKLCHVLYDDIERRTNANSKFHQMDMIKFVKNHSFQHILKLCQVISSREYLVQINLYLKKWNMRG